MKNQRFESAAKTYNQYAFIQKLSAEYILNYQLSHVPMAILDIGCGTGLLTSRLASKYPRAHFDAIDASQRMIKQVSTLGLKNVTSIHADYSQYELKKRYDLIASNAALHWMNIPDALSKIKQELSERGVVVCTIFGSNTSIELSTLIPMIKKGVMLPARQFMTNDQINQCGQKKFTYWSVETSTTTIPFDSVYMLFKTQKKTGVNASLAMSGLWTPRQLKQLEQLFMAHYGQIQLSYEIHFCIGSNQ